MAEVVPRNPSIHGCIDIANSIEFEACSITLAGHARPIEPAHGDIRGPFVLPVEILPPCAKRCPDCFASKTYRAVESASMLRSILFTAALSACVTCLAAWSIDTDRSTPDKHGLFEIREEASLFIAQENAKGHEQWSVLEPNAKVLVPRCAVPLQAHWTPKSLGRSKPSVAVICAAAVPNEVMRQWDVHVPVRQKPD
ncbi:UNVERIFIED_ORG: hypothetical protein GGI63_000734 [Rhizobium esperanzae]